MIAALAVLIVPGRVYGMVCRVNVNGAVPVIVRLALVNLRGDLLALHRAGPVGVEPRHSRAVQHERRHGRKHDARDEATKVVGGSDQMVLLAPITYVLGQGFQCD